MTGENTTQQRRKKKCAWKFMHSKDPMSTSFYLAFLVRAGGGHLFQGNALVLGVAQGQVHVLCEMVSINADWKLVGTGRTYEDTG